MYSGGESIHILYGSKYSVESKSPAFRMSFKFIQEHVLKERILGIMTHALL